MSHVHGFNDLVDVYAPQPVLSLKEALVSSNANIHNPVVCKPTNQFANDDCDLGSTVSSPIQLILINADHRSGIRASDDILVVPEPDRRGRTEEQNIGHLRTSALVHHHATSYLRSIPH